MEVKKEDILVKLGNRIVQIRNEKNIRQIDLAITSNIDDGSIRRIETGKQNVTVKILDRIAHALDVSIKDLFDFN